MKLSSINKTLLSILLCYTSFIKAAALPIQKTHGVVTVKVVTSRSNVGPVHCTLMQGEEVMTQSIALAKGLITNFTCPSYPDRILITAGEGVTTFNLRQPVNGNHYVHIFMNKDTITVTVKNQEDKPVEQQTSRNKFLNLFQREALNRALYIVRHRQGKQTTLV